MPADNSKACRCPNCGASHKAAVAINTITRCYSCGVDLLFKPGRDPIVVRHSGNTTGEEKQTRSNSESNDKRERNTIVRDEHYYAAVLNVAPGAKLTEIKRAYREQVKKYHPDRVDDLATEFKDLANEKTKEITEAFQFFSQKLG